MLPNPLENISRVLRRTPRALPQPIFAAKGNREASRGEGGEARKASAREAQPHRQAHTHRVHQATSTRPQRGHSDTTGSSSRATKQAGRSVSTSHVHHGMPPVLCTAVPVSVSAPAYDPRVQSAAGLRVCCRPLLSARLHLPAGLRACHISLRSPVQVRRPATCHASSQKPCWLPACHGSRPTSEHIQAELPPVPEEKSGITHPGAVPSRVMLVPPRVRPFYCQSIGTANGAPPLRDHAHAP